MAKTIIEDAIDDRRRTDDIDNDINNNFDFVACSARHSLGIRQGVLYSWGRSNAVGQLGRSGKSSKILPVAGSFSTSTTHQQQQRQPVKAYVGGAADAGHSAILDSQGDLWLTGCDRWQQLGLGAATLGATGYTWVGGSIMQTSFQRNVFIKELIQQHDPSAHIRDVAGRHGHSKPVRRVLF